MRTKLLLAFTCFLTAALAQVSTADLSGTITDQTGGVIPDVRVTLINSATGAHRTSHTDGAGRYSFEDNPPGLYRVTAQITGFQTEIAPRVELTVGEKAVLNLGLKVGQIHTETVVAATAEIVDTRDTSLSSVMQNVAIRELPLNGRDFAQLALLQPGVESSLRTSDSGGPGTKLVIQGNRPSQVSFLLDGSDINDASNNTPGSAAGVLLGVDTLQQFRVVTNAFSAEYGRASGGIISAVTKSGTNTLHGSLFEFVRNSDFDAKNYFDSQTAPIPAFKRNQFGVEVDGPIIKNKTFFLGSFEAVRQRLGVTSVSVVPDANAREGIIPGQAPITVDPSVQGYLALIPLPNGQNFGDGTGRYSLASSQPTNETFFTGRLDHHLSDATSLFARFSYDTAIGSVPDGFDLSQADSQSLNHYLTLGGTHAFNERWLDTFRFSYNRSYSASNIDFLRPVDPSLAFLPGDPLGEISVTGFFELGPSRFSPSNSTLDLYEFSDDVSHTFGRNSLKVGADYRFYLLPTIRPQSPYGYYQFNSLVNFLEAKPQSVEMTLPSSTLARDWRQSMFAAYLQDDIRLTPRLTLNAGIRYERESVPVEAHGLSADLRNPVSDSEPTVGPMYRNPTNLGFAPRVGMAWDPFGDGKTSIRAGFGVYYDPLWSDYYANAGGRTPPFYVLGSIKNPVFPDAYSLVNSPAFILGRQDAVQYRPNYPYVLQDNFTVQRQVGLNRVITAAYVGEHGIHLPRFVDENQSPQTILPDGQIFFPVGSTVQNPNFTGIRYKETNGTSYYNALQLSFEQRFSRSLLLHADYTFSKNIDTGSIDQTQGGNNDLPQNPVSTKAERGLSNYDVRNYFVVYTVWDLPSAPGPKVLTSGWQLNAITTLSSGQPFSAVVGFDRARANPQAGTSPERPDLCPGASNNPILGNPTQYFNPAAFCLQPAGYYGNLGRNTLIGPGIIMVNPSLSKVFHVNERIHLQFRAEMFNLLNHPNFAIPSQRTVFSSSGPVASAGLITATTTSSRQLQLGLKMTF
jgi:Carboxypeptidase regulatory-like domain/TonB dependent receptor-like, beta-barrel/TonB-dependent Receptor Plug Domain